MVKLLHKLRLGMIELQIFGFFFKVAEIAWTGPFIYKAGMSP